LDDEFKAVDEAMLSQILMKSLDAQQTASCSRSPPSTPTALAFTSGNVTPTTPASPTPVYQVPRQVGRTTSEDTVTPANYLTLAEVAHQAVVGGAKDVKDDSLS
jgi:hypothetical protein